MCPGEYSRSVGYDVADVDCFVSLVLLCLFINSERCTVLITHGMNSGIMFGYVSSLAFYHVKDPKNITGLNWRLMLGSAGVPAIFVMAQVYLLPESPRWLLKKGRYVEAFQSMCRVRNSKLQAARDLYYIHVLVEEEAAIERGRNLALELFTVPRVRRATLASGIVMFMQQFCGVNVIVSTLLFSTIETRVLIRKRYTNLQAYYSSTIFRQGGFSIIDALLGSWGFGMLNFLAAIPAVYTIDTFGRRKLLLTTFPCMAVCLLITGLGFQIGTDHPSARIGVIAFGIYLFTIFYSPGEGPVPFTYSAEAFPLYIRDVGMSFATATTWTFNFIVALTFPRLLSSFSPTGAFGWYAGWNMIGWLLILLFVPETKSLSLEELDQGWFHSLSAGSSICALTSIEILIVFNVPTRRQAKYGVASLVHAIRKYLLRQNVPDQPPPHSDGGYIHHGQPTGRSTSFEGGTIQPQQREKQTSGSRDSRAV